MNKFVTDMVDGSQRKRVFLFSLVGLLVILSWVGVFDRLSTEYVDGAIVQSTIAFGVAKGLNAMISVLQSTTINFSLVAGGSITVGELLDPLNDLVEQYSSMMKLAIGSLVIQKLLIEITSDYFFKIIVTVAALLLVASTYVKDAYYTNFFSKLFVFLIFIRFALVLVIYLNSVVDNAFIHDKTEAEIAVLEVVSNDANSMEKKGVLSEEERAAQLKKMALLEQEQQGLVSLRDLTQTQLKALIEKRSESEVDLSALQENKSLIQRFTSTDENTEELKKQISELSAQIKVKEAELKVMVKEIEHQADQMVDIQNILDGKSQGIFSSMRNGVAEAGEKAAAIGDSMRLSKMADKLEETSSNILNLMALFIFKTLILPLIFLLLLIKGTNLIWNIDVKASLQFAVNELRPKKEA